MPRIALAFALAAGLAAAPAAASEKKGTGDATYLKMPPVAATSFSPSRRGVLTVELGLDVKDEALRTKAQALQPRLRDAWVTSLQSYARSLGGGAPNADQVSKDLQRETDRVLGKPGAKLLLGTILVN